MHGVNIITQKNESRAKQRGPIPITYFQATLLWKDAPFSFIHLDPIDGYLENVTMLEPAKFIPAALFDLYELCTACGQFEKPYHACEARD